MEELTLSERVALAKAMVNEAEQKHPLGTASIADPIQAALYQRIRTLREQLEEDDDLLIAAVAKVDQLRPRILKTAADIETLAAAMASP